MSESRADQLEKALRKEVVGKEYSTLVQQVRTLFGKTMKREGFEVQLTFDNHAPRDIEWWFPLIEVTGRRH